MTPEEATELLLNYTTWLNGRGNLHYLENRPVAPLVEKYLKQKPPAEIKPDSTILLCPHHAKEMKPVVYQFALGDVSLRVCQVCYDSIRATFLEELINTALKDLFREMRESKRKSAPSSSPFIG